jgi:hypothetical protein
MNIWLITQGKITEDKRVFSLFLEIFTSTFFRLILTIGHPFFRDGARTGNGRRGMGLLAEEGLKTRGINEIIFFCIF